MHQYQAFVQLQQAILAEPTTYPDHSVVQDLILKNGCIWLPSGFSFIPTLLLEYHSSPTDAHIGVTKTMARLSENFTWIGIRKDVEQFVAACLDCQYTKYEAQKMAGLLCPLPVPCRPWEDLSFNFIIGLSEFRGYTAILVVVGRFSKGIHLGMLPTCHTVVVLFIEIVRKIHGMPRSLVSDRDPLFISQFWRELFRLSDTRLRMSSVYQPQTDGQTEVLNHIIEQSLRAFVHNKPSTWGKFLSWVEWSYNTSCHSSSGMSPYKITFGKKPFNILQYLAGTSVVAANDDMLTNMEAVSAEVRKKLLKAQALMKQNADKKKKDANLKEGDWVMVKLYPHRQAFIFGNSHVFSKLNKRYYGPYKVLTCIGKAAYKLELPEGARIHLVFHCSLLKPFHSTADKANIPLPLPETIIDKSTNSYYLGHIRNLPRTNEWRSKSAGSGSMEGLIT